MSFESVPLAERMRPKLLDDYIGQEHLIGPKGPIRRALDAGILPSIILWGPPGVGKTTLAYLLADQLKSPFYSLSAISSGVKDVREIIAKASQNQGLFQSKQPVVFIDEIHRFSKSQQDSVLGAVEKGIITLIGATTENPSFEVISALLSRCQVYTLREHTKEDLLKIIYHALATDSILNTKKIVLNQTNALLAISGGDARKLLNLLELVVSTANQNEQVEITDELTKSIASESLARYDKDGEQHFDIISAFIKSIRGSDPNAAVYWLARMVEGGEDPKFIARRLIILASEDIGLANPNALLLATSCFQAVEMIGWPESRIILSQCTIYLASSPKGNAAYKAINHAQEIVRQTGNVSVPLHLRNAPTRLMNELGYGTNYLYPHDYPENFVQLEFMPDELKNTSFFSAGSNSKEKEIEQFIDNKWANKYKKP
ncbi:MAG: replication-associated recombination protein A [Bacteroidetes bacterium]|nr:replication-associated recombination protein A [Bacteroidota bacterium]